VAGNPGTAPVVLGLFVKNNTKALFRALRPSFRISLPALASSSLARPGFRPGLGFSAEYG
jgi:hypothetical protein